MSLDKDALTKQFSGEIIWPGDAQFDEARTVFMRQGNPAVILRPHTNEDVVVAIQYAQDNQLIFSVKSGGHGGPGLSTNDGGVMLDLRALNQVEVDEATGMVRLGSGAVWGDVAAVLEKHNLALSSGDTKSVGIGGLTLGGGVGWLVRTYGLALDSLVAAEVVIANGQILRVSATENEDLFWAIRGGGGNFGVITYFEFQAHPLSGIWAAKIQYSLDNLEELIRNWRDYMRTAPEELNTTLLVMPAFGDVPPSANVWCCYAGDDEKLARAALEPLLQLGTVVKQELGPQPYGAILEEAHPPQGVKVLVHNGFAIEFSDDLIRAMAAHHGQPTSPVLMVRSLGGAMSRVPAQATAFAYRKVEGLVISGAFVPLTATEAEMKKAIEPWQALSPFLTGAYCNFLNEATEAEVALIYPPDTYQRLVAIKKVYDPDNFFNQNFNIKPSN